MMAALVPALLTEYLALFRPHFSKPSFSYFSGYLVSLLLTSGRKTMRRVAHTCFFVERHLASWERFLSEYKWDLNAVLTSLLQRLIAQLGDDLQIHGAYLAALDTWLVAKNGHAMPGVQAWHDHSGNADRGKRIRGHHWAILGLIAWSATWDRYLCFPWLLRLISGQSNPCQMVVDAAGVAHWANFWECVLPLLWQLQQGLGDAPLRVVADAYFSKAPFLNPLVQAGIHVISRLRKDAVGWDNPTPEQRADAKHGQKWKLAQLLQHEVPQTVTAYIYGHHVTVQAVTRIVWLRNVTQQVKVVVLAGIKKPIILMATDVSLTATQIIEIYAARFTIELAIRDLKQYFGLGDYQCYRGSAIHRFVHLACVAFCGCRLIQLRHPKWLPAPPRGVAPTSFAHLRTALRRFLVGRILAPTSAENPEVPAKSAELDAVLRITA
jgi:hypothetical protein